MRTPLLIAAIALAACGNSKPKPADPGPGSGSDATEETGSGSAVEDGSGPGEEVGSGSAADAGSSAGSADGSGAGPGSGDAVHEHDEGDTFLALDRDKKLEIMKKQVLPAMAKAFKAFDKKEFGKFTCKTCHGKGVADGSYEMPNPDLHKLDFAALSAGKDHPKTAEFMAKTVVPEMAKMLGLEAATESNPTGFGCLHCHTLKQ